MLQREPVEVWYKQFWPWFIFGLPATVVVASIITVVIAVIHDDGLVVKDYYKDGLAINRELELEKNAQLLAVNASISFEKNTEKIRIRLVGDFPDEPTSIKLLLSHPTDQYQDQSFLLTRGEQNQYFVQLNKSLVGRWYIRLSDAESELWRVKSEIDLNAVSSVDINAAETL